MELQYGHFLLTLVVGILCWIGGGTWVNHQWMNCAHSEMDMRIKGKYLYRVDYLGIERKRKI